jgi:hypothetical protein
MIWNTSSALEKNKKDSTSDLKKINIKFFGKFVHLNAVMAMSTIKLVRKRQRTEWKKQ